MPPSADAVPEFEPPAPPTPPAVEPIPPVETDGAEAAARLTATTTPHHRYAARARAGGIPASGGGAAVARVTWCPSLEALGIFLAGLAAGTINTVVGSGTLITFPTLLFFGYPPLTPTCPTPSASSPEG